MLKGKKIIIFEIILALIAAYAGYLFLSEQQEYYVAEKKYQKIQKECLFQGIDEEAQEKKQKKTNSFTTKFNYQKAIEHNTEIVGYILLNDSVINYPIVRHSDNTYYLTHDAYRNNSIYGAIFLDASCKKNLNEKHVIIYGHHMDNGSMFGDISNFRDIDFAKNHTKFTIFNYDKKETYQVVSSFETNPLDKELYKIDFSSQKEEQKWIDYVLKKSHINYKQTFTTEDQTIILSTCTNRGDTRSVVVAKKV